ncbi:MarR family winged helix-turn-helix transcriptional regulator [Streptomyces megasporus]|uniref:MarR family winged helix-turn-helix transcriptional regulator n=1 Tax=Streptomyces megasporus TaxID=44060 RepID=UPI00068D613A|nr:MarR family transcriptional regulator [Streptomyces megasporus]
MAAEDGRDAGSARDIVARVLSQWQQVRPELDTAPMAVIGRLNRCVALLQQAEEAPLVREGLARPEFDILTTLRREDRAMTPGQIARETFASGAAVTKRLRLLEERGLVGRRTSARDRRVSEVSLSDEGRELIDRLLPDQLAYESELLSGLTDGQRAELSAILAELLVLLEGRLGGLRS